MNVINLSVDFVKRTIKQTGVNLTSGDYNSTKLVFEFDDEYEGTKVCEIAKKEDKDGNNEAIFAGEIINNEVVLGALADITDDNGYIKYKDSSSNIYWYDEDNSQLYDSEYNTSSVSLDTLTKVQQNVSIFDEAGKYVLEISLYGEDSKLTSACTDLIVKPGMVRVGDLKVVQYISVFDTLMNQATTIIDELEEADETMESHETTRQSNETARQSNETTRQSNETTRQSNETSRTNAETSRAAAETTRQSNETSRQSAETSRAEAETARSTAETNRSSAESTRQSNESSRTSAESSRNTAEQGRVSAETSRVSAESTRASNESGRQSAENTRASNETTRQSNETSRTSAEEARATAETGRSTAETTRASNETTRQSNETTRQSNETTRQSNETTRQSNETTRQANELIREAKIVEIKAENKRILKNTPKGTTDTNPTIINDSADLPLEKFALKGKTEQNTTTGKNIASNIFNEYTSGSTYLYRKLIDNFTSTYLVCSLIDNDTSVSLSGVYLGFSGNGSNANDGVSWIINNGEDTGNRITNIYKYLSIYPNNEETFNKIFTRFKVQITLQNNTQPSSYEPYTRRYTISKSRFPTRNSKCR